MTGLIVALDVESLREAEELVKRLKGTVTHYKVGLRLFTAHGPKAVELVRKYGGTVFLDLKLHDIPQTVVHAVEEAQKLGVSSVSVHLMGGAAMVRAAAAVAPRPKLWGVSVLTSHGDQDVRLLNPRATTASMVRRLARMGWQSGMDALICSVREVESLRKGLKHLALKFVTPGIRPSGGPAHDQHRTAAPEEAAALGVDHIVVGRPIIRAQDPLRAAQDILAAMKHAAPSALERQP